MKQAITRNTKRKKKKERGVRDINPFAIKSRFNRKFSLAGGGRGGGQATTTTTEG